MVILGGLEIVAAGYILKEINKDDKRSQSAERERRRRRKHQHDHDHEHRPSRPPAQGLAPPNMPGPARPTSAPPPKMRPMYNQQPPMPAGPMGMPQGGTWPHPSQQPQAQSYYNHNHNTPPPAYAQIPHGQGPPPPPGPGMMQHNPTMHFDMKTGKWQSGMLPRDDHQGKRERGLSDSAGAERSLNHQQQPRRQESWSSVSSGSSGSESDEKELAYGRDYGRGAQAPRRVMSHDRERPGTRWQQVYAELPVNQEHDWYAAQKQRGPAMAGVVGQVMGREGRASTMPNSGYAQSAPQLVVSELDGTGVVRKGTGQGQVYAELDSRETERYKAYRS